MNRQEPALRIGTRGSPLALAQAAEVRGALLGAHPGLAAAPPEIVVINTTGDRVTERPLADLGGKGLFTKEIEEVLLSGAVDLAVHSMKDVPTALPEGLMIACLLPREDPRDALICDGAATLAALPVGAVIGTASLRRKAQILHARPDLNVANLRGNVQTRIRKIADGAADATLLALAGLRRLGLADRARAVLEPDEMLPAVAQGAIGIECRAGDETVRALLAPLDHAETADCIAAERGLLAALDGSCRTPIAALATVSAPRQISLRAMVLRPDGSEIHETTRAGAAEDAAAMGRDAGAELKARAGPNFLTDIA
jgi:hydroxymethylbilane synthase